MASTLTLLRLPPGRGSGKPGFRGQAPRTRRTGNPNQVRRSRRAAFKTPLRPRQAQQRRSRAAAPPPRKVARRALAPETPGRRRVGPTGSAEAAAAMLAPMPLASRPEEAILAAQAAVHPTRCKMLEAGHRQHTQRGHDPVLFRAGTDARSTPKAQDRVRLAFILSGIIAQVLLDASRVANHRVADLLTGMKATSTTMALAKKEAQRRRDQSMPAVDASTSQAALHVDPDSSKTFGDEESHLLHLHGVARSQDPLANRAFRNAQQQVKVTLIYYVVKYSDTATRERLRDLEYRIRLEIDDPDHPRQPDEHQPYVSEVAAAVMWQKDENGLERARHGCDGAERQTGQSFKHFIQECRMQKANLDRESKKAIARGEPGGNGMSRKWWLKKIDANLHPDEARDMKIKYPTAHYYEETLESLEQRAEEMEVGGYRYAWKKYMYSGRTHVVVTSAIPSRIRSRGRFDQGRREPSDARKPGPHPARRRMQRKDRVPLKARRAARSAVARGRAASRRPKSAPTSGRSASTRPCRFIANGKKCKYGDKCRFSHDVPPAAERRPPARLRTAVARVAVAAPANATHEATAAPLIPFLAPFQAQVRRAFAAVVGCAKPAAEKGPAPLVPYDAEEHAAAAQEVYDEASAAAVERGASDLGTARAAAHATSEYNEVVRRSLLDATRDCAINAEYDDKTYDQLKAAAAGNAPMAPTLRPTAERFIPRPAWMEQSNPPTLQATKDGTVATLTNDLETLDLRTSTLIEPGSTFNYPLRAFAMFGDLVRAGTQVLSAIGPRGALRHAVVVDVSPSRDFATLDELAVTVKCMARRHHVPAHRCYNMTNVRRRPGDCVFVEVLVPAHTTETRSRYVTETHMCFSPENPHSSVHPCPGMRVRAKVTRFAATFKGTVTVVNPSTPWQVQVTCDDDVDDPDIDPYTCLTVDLEGLGDGALRRALNIDAPPSTTLSPLNAWWQVPYNSDVNAQEAPRHDTPPPLVALLDLQVTSAERGPNTISLFEDATTLELGIAVSQAYADTDQQDLDQDLRLLYRWRELRLVPTITLSDLGIRNGDNIVASWLHVRGGNDDPPLESLSDTESDQDEAKVVPNGTHAVGPSVPTVRAGFAEPPGPDPDCSGITIDYIYQDYPNRTPKQMLEEIQRQMRALWDPRIQGAWCTLFPNAQGSPQPHNAVGKLVLVCMRLGHLLRLLQQQYPRLYADRRAGRYTDYGIHRLMRELLVHPNHSGLHHYTDIADPLPSPPTAKPLARKAPNEWPAGRGKPKQPRLTPKGRGGKSDLTRDYTSPLLDSGAGAGPAADRTTFLNAATARIKQERKRPRAGTLWAPPSSLAQSGQVHALAASVTGLKSALTGQAQSTAALATTVRSRARPADPRLPTPLHQLARQGPATPATTPPAKPAQRSSGQRKLSKMFRQRRIVNRDSWAAQAWRDVLGSRRLGAVAAGLQPPLEPPLEPPLSPPRLTRQRTHSVAEGAQDQTPAPASTPVPSPEPSPRSPAASVPQTDQDEPLTPMDPPQAARESVGTPMVTRSKARET